MARSQAFRIPQRAQRQAGFARHREAHGHERGQGEGRARQVHPQPLRADAGDEGADGEGIEVGQAGHVDLPDAEAQDRPAREAQRRWKRPQREWHAAKTQLAVRFPERFA